MDRRIQFAIFISIFLIVFAGLHFYVVLRLAGLFGIPKSAWLYLLASLLAVFYIAASIVERTIPRKTTRFIYILASYEVGMVFLFFSTLVLFEILHLFLALPRTTWAWSILSVAGLASIYAAINAQIVKVHKIRIPLKGLKKPLKVVQLSDLHIGTIHKTDFLGKIVKITNELNPDAVFMTGDLFDSSAPLSEDDLSPLNNLKAPWFFITGNHETYEGLDGVYKLMKTTKAKILKNQKIKWKDLQLIGVEYNEDKKDLVRKLKNLKPNKKSPNILLYHSPLSLDLLSKLGINLQLAGHTHNGQIFPFNFLVRLANPYNKGLHEKGNSKIFVTTGAGTWGPPMRLGSNNEIVLLDLVPE